MHDLRQIHSITSLSSRYFARKTKTSTYYKPVAKPVPSNAIKPSTLENEKLGKEVNKVTRQRVPNYLPDEIRFQQLMETDFTAETQMKEEAARIQSKNLFYLNIFKGKLKQRP